MLTDLFYTRFIRNSIPELNKRRFSGYLVLFLIVILTSITPPAYLQAQDYWVNEYDTATVVSAERLATDVGIQILKKGGNAVDAAVAVHFALAVTYPQAGNLGGGGFMVIHLPDSDLDSDSGTISYDFRETAPALATKDMFLDSTGTYNPKLARRSILSSGVPGSVHGVLTALDNHGNLSRNQVLQPAILLARNGYRLDTYQASMLNKYRKNFGKYVASTKYFKPCDKLLYKQGDLFKQTDLANTLTLIKNRGIRGFYTGPTATKIINTVQKHNGLLTLEDLKSYKSKRRTPISAEYHGFELHMMGPPSSGGITIAQMLLMLSDYDVKQLGFMSAKYIHMLSEVMKRAYADRNYFLGDPDFNNIPIRSLLDTTYIRKRMADFNWESVTSSKDIKHGDITSFVESSETTHYSVIDNDGYAVSVTTTLNSLFGNKIAVDGAGFLLNNEMDDFTSKPGVPNQFGLVQGKTNIVEANKRMLSSMTPTIVTRNDSVKMVLGAAGGPRIITTVLQNFLNMSLFDMNAMQSISAPRIHHQWLPDVTYIENYAISRDTKQILLELGHSINKVDNIANSHIIYVNKGKYTGAADPRGNGSVEGF